MPSKRSTPTPKVLVTCCQCGTTVLRYQSWLRKNPGKSTYCSRACWYRSPHFSPEIRFWAKVSRNGPIIRPELGRCWVWTGKRNTNGYGRLTFNGRMRGAHVVAYVLTTGQEPPAETPNVLHHCDGGDIGCVRPSHLYAGTLLDNSRDAIVRNRTSRGPSHAASTSPERRSRGEKHAQKLREVLPRGAECSWTKLSDDDVAEIRRRYAAGGIRQRDLAHQYGITQSSVSDIVAGKSWTHVVV